MSRLLGVVVGVVMLGCGGVADKFEEKAAEVAAEKLIEHQTGGAVDLSDGKVSLTRDGVAAEIGVGATLPTDWPTEIAPLPGQSAQGVTRSASPASPGKFDYFAMFQSTSDCPTIVKHYKDQLAGWTVQNEMAFESTITVAFSRPDGSAQVALGCSKNEDNTTMTTVSWNNSLVAPAGQE